MKAAFLCCVLLLAGSASCGPVEASSISLPDSVPDWIVELVGQLPGSIQEIIDRLPEILEAIPDLLENLPEIIQTIIDRIPEVIPIIIDNLPEIIDQLPAILEQLPGFLEQVINKLPEYIPIIIDRIPQVVAAFPGLYEAIREILQTLDLPDWFPTLPEFETPEWWPEELPTIPEYNEAVPGTQTTVEEYPGIVQIEVGSGSVWVQGCTGTILTSLHVLSSARCFYGRNYDVRFRRVRAGSSTRYTDGDIVQIQFALNHPSFGENSIDGDISLVRLGINLVLGSTIQQTAIVPSGFNLPAGISVKLAGWGSTAQGVYYANRDLYEIDLVVIDQEVCTTSWSRIPVFSITNNMICVGRPETAGRNGDIRDFGAPVFYEGVLVGVTSLSVPIGNQVFPVVTTKIGSYTDWIVANAV